MFDSLFGKREASDAAARPTFGRYGNPMKRAFYNNSPENASIDDPDRLTAVDAVLYFRKNCLTARCDLDTKNKRLASMAAASLNCRR